jgi:aminopeptidase
MSDRWRRLAELAVFGANVQPGQIVMVNAEYEHAEPVRAAVAAAYRAGAKFVDVNYFDPHVKRARLENADPATLDFVPAWYGQARLEHANARGARIVFSGVAEPNLLDGLDPERLGRDQLPRLKENSTIVGERTTNWTIVPAPHPVWASLVYPELGVDEAYERLWQEIEHVLRLDEPDPARAWNERLETLSRHAGHLTERRFDAIHFAGPGTDLTIGLLPSSHWQSADFATVDGLRHFPNLPSEEIFTTPDPERTEGHVTSTKPLVLVDGTIVRGLRMRFEGGRAVEVEADENGAALRASMSVDDGGAKLGEVALVDRHGRIGALGTVFYDTLLDENAASHIAVGSGFPFLVDDGDLSRVNESATHVDFMIGSPELNVDGITAGGERVPVLRGGDFQV